jgi:hypothetical protein
MSSDIVERLREREAKLRECIANSQVVIDLLAPQMTAFKKRDGSHNIYAVRMSVDHKSSVRTTTKEADELRDAADHITALEAKLAEAREMMAWARETLVEINPSNYDHDDVCELNAKSVEVILGLDAEIRSLAEQTPAHKENDDAKG